MASLINRHRMLKNWSILEADRCEMIATVWIDFLDRYGIPAEAYEALYARATDARISKIREGKDAGELTAEALVAVWTGPNGLKAELEAKRVEAGRFLTGNAQTQCPKCFGSGFEYLKDDAGRTLGVKGRCDHSAEEF